MRSPIAKYCDLLIRPAMGMRHTDRAGNHLLEMLLIFGGQGDHTDTNIATNKMRAQHTWSKTKHSHIVQIEPCDETSMIKYGSGKFSSKLHVAFPFWARSWLNSNTVGSCAVPLRRLPKHLRTRFGASTHCLGMRVPDVKRHELNPCVARIFTQPLKQHDTQSPNSTTEALRNIKKAPTPSTCQVASPKFLASSFDPLWLESPAINWSHEWRWQACRFWKHPVAIRYHQIMARSRIPLRVLATARHHGT